MGYASKLYAQGVREKRTVDVRELSVGLHIDWKDGSSKGDYGVYSGNARTIPEDFRLPRSLLVCLSLNCQRMGRVALMLMVR